MKPQEVNSLVQLPRSEDPVSGNKLRECLNFETLKKEIQFTEVCEDESFWKRVSIGMCYKTIADVDDGFGDRTPALQRENTPSFWFRFQILCRNPTTNCDWTSCSSSCFSISLTHGIDIQIPSTSTPHRNSWVATCRGKNRYVDESHLRDPGHNPTSSEVLLEKIHCKRK